MNSHSKVLTFADEVRAIPGGEHLEMCYSCGTCVSKCMIQQKTEPEYNPRRLLRLVMMDEREEAFKSPTTWMCSECDLCYPACPQKIHISGVIGAVKKLAISAGYKSPLETVKVDDKACSGCGICVMVCPYGAPHLIEKKNSGIIDRVSKIDKNLCMRCGTCVAACPLGAVSRKGVSNQDIFKQIKIKEPLHHEPTLAVFICDWSLRANEDMEILESYPQNVRIIHIPCTGRIDPQMALSALRSGINGVLVCGCKPGECHFKRGTYVSASKITMLHEMFEQVYSNKGQRIRFIQIGTQERGRIEHEVDSMLTFLASNKEIL